MLGNVPCVGPDDDQLQSVETLIRFFEILHEVTQDDRHEFAGIDLFTAN